VCVWMWVCVCICDEQSEHSEMSAMQDTAARRIASLASHISAPGSKITAVREPLPAEQAPEWLDHMRTDGWGYADTEFQVNGDGKIALAGSRYPFSGFVFPNFRPWVEKVVGINVEDEVSRSPQRRPVPPVENAAFLAKIEGCCKRMSSSDKDRIFHGHGHTCQEVYAVRFGELERVPDLVVWPGSHDHVEAVVKLASENNVVIIPFGGGTSVSGALSCPTNEKRMIVSLDMHEMNAIKWIDAENMLVCMEAGIVGQDLKRRLEASGYTIGAFLHLFTHARVCTLVLPPLPSSPLSPSISLSRTHSLSCSLSFSLARSFAVSRALSCHAHAHAHIVTSYLPRSNPKKKKNGDTISSHSSFCAWSDEASTCSHTRRIVLTHDHHTYTYTRAHTHTCMHTHTCIHTHMHTHTHAHTHSHTCTHTQTNAHYTHTYMHTSTHTHTLTHTLTHTWN